MNLPLPEELAIQWPSEQLVLLPYLESDWSPAEETLARAPVLAPKDPGEPSVAKVSRSIKLSDALKRDDLSDVGIDLSDHELYQSELQSLRSKLNTDYQTLRSQSHERIAQAQELYDLVLTEAESAYRQAMRESGLAMDGISAEDYALVYQRFAQESLLVQESYQAKRKAIDARYDVALSSIHRSHAEQLRTAARNRRSRSVAVTFEASARARWTRAFAGASGVSANSCSAAAYCIATFACPTDSAKERTPPTALAFSSSVDCGVTSLYAL
jgi:hypothetical protein